MPVLPSKKVEEIQFGESHWPVWNVSPTSIGMSTQSVQAVKTAVMAARLAFDQANAARQAAKAATVGSDNAIRAMHELLAEAVQQIRLYAETTNNPNVYQLAQIPPPAAPTPALAPTKPVNIKLQLETDGGLTIQWKAAANSPSTPNQDDSTQGVQYSIYRRLPGESSLRLVGTANPPRRGGKRAFATWTDDDIPTGSNGITYAIQGTRGTLEGPMSDAFVVTLGMGGGGLTATMTPATGVNAVKMAA